MARSWRSQIADEVRATSMMKPKPMKADDTEDSAVCNWCGYRVKNRCKNAEDRSNCDLS